MLDATVAVDTHPVVSQLSALHRFRIQVDVAVVIVVLVLTNLVAHFTTPWASVATVPAAAVGLVALLRFNGLGWAELGLGRDHWKSGVAYALAAMALVVTVIAVGVLLPLTRPMFMNNHYATISGALVASMIIIPLQTVIPEELAFQATQADINKLSRTLAGPDWFAFQPSKEPVTGVIDMDAWLDGPGLRAQAELLDNGPTVEAMSDWARAHRINLIGGSVAILADGDRVENVVVLGMGGSGIAGDVLAA